jgi:hypothetical protein
MKQVLNKYTLGIAIVCLLIGRFVLQPKATVIEKIKTVEVEKKVFVEKKNKKETKIEITRPDGTKEVKTEITEVSESEMKSDRKSVAESSKESRTGSGVTVGVLALKDLQAFSKDFQYGVTVTAPIYNSIKVQALGTTDRRIGLGIALEF